MDACQWQTPQLTWIKPPSQPSLLIALQVDGRVAAVDPRSGRVDCGDDALRDRIEAAVGRLAAALAPAALDAFEGAYGQQCGAGTLQAAISNKPAPQ